MCQNVPSGRTIKAKAGNNARPTSSSADKATAARSRTEHTGESTRDSCHHMHPHDRSPNCPPASTRCWAVTVPEGGFSNVRPVKKATANPTTEGASIRGRTLPGTPSPVTSMVPNAEAGAHRFSCCGCRPGQCTALPPYLLTRFPRTESPVLPSAEAMHLLRAG